jgi:hypothetical protein
VIDTVVSTDFTIGVVAVGELIENVVWFSSWSSLGVAIPEAQPQQRRTS